MIDEQIDIIDRIILYDTEAPNLYKKLLENKEKLDNM